MRPAPTTPRRRALLCSTSCGTHATHLVGNDGPLLLLLCPTCLWDYQVRHDWALRSRPIKR